ncbi:MAG: hypothetical protein IJS34_00320 [Alphaproteobacteria bacterium]|nr:hypothetical protein [Alphaproteobacteria bacterium]
MKKFLFGILGLLFAVPAVAATLPAGYTELEYIEGTGTQYITTDVIANQNTSAEIKFVPTSVYKSNGVFGARTSKTSDAFNIWEPGIEGVIIANLGNKGAIVSNVTPVLNEAYVVYLSSTRFSVNDYTTTISGTENFSTPSGLQLFNIYGGNCVTVTTSTESNRIFSGKVYYFKVWQGDSLALNLIPAKNASGVIGMYDTVNDVFYTNQGSGTFTAGPEMDPCRNLFDGGIYARGQWNNDGEWLTTQSATRIVGSLVPITPNTTYTMKINNTSDDVVFWNYAYFDANKNWLGNRTTNNETTFSGTTEKTFNITDANARYFAPIVAVNDGITNISDTMFANAHLQLELGSTATEYVPFCANAIKIATTAYNSARFSPVVTELNDTIATIRDVVTNTINQTKAIADLQATKQTRPDETCPAGKKCLLVEDNEGQPHWYEIIESAD